MAADDRCAGAHVAQGFAVAGHKFKRTEGRGCGVGLPCCSRGVKRESKIGFAAESAEEAEGWHKAGVANGGTAIEDAPGIRQGASGNIFLAYLRDPDGNKLCALHRMAA